MRGTNQIVESIIITTSHVLGHVSVLAAGRRAQVQFYVPGVKNEMSEHRDVSVVSSAILLSTMELGHSQLILSLA